MSNIIILGDVHLGAGSQYGKVGIGAKLNSKILDQFELLDWVLEKAIDSLSNDIIITGDVFEEPKPHYSLITMFAAWLNRCASHYINVHIIIGNHDILRVGNLYSSPLDIINEMSLQNVHLYKDISTTYINDVAVTLMPFRDRKSLSASSIQEAIAILGNNLYYELSSIPSIQRKIIIGHFAIEGSIPVGYEIDDLSNEIFCPLDMFSGYDYVWMGHIHKPQVLQTKNPYIAHIGSMDISNVSEANQTKHIVIFNCEDSSFSHVNIPIRKFENITISVPTDLVGNQTDFILKELSKFDLKQCIVNISVNIDSESQLIEKDIIESQLMRSGVFNVSGFSLVRKSEKIKKDTLNNLSTKMGVAEAIKMYAERYIDEGERSNFIQTSTDIYNSFRIDSKE